MSWPPPRRCPPLLLALLLPLVALACHPARYVPLDERDGNDSSRGDSNRLLMRVGQARGLPPHQEVPLYEHDDESFLRILLRHRVERIKQRLAEGKGDDQSGAVPVAFGFGGLQGTPDGKAVAKDQQILAFYDLNQREIHVRRRLLWGDSLQRDLILAHETAHAIQQQSFNLERVQTARHADEALAHLALVEGDAQATALAYVAQQNRLPTRRVLARVASYLKQDTQDVLVALDTQATRAGLSRAELETLHFPYDKGLLFATALYRAGGWLLVNRAFSKPPSSSEQVLHPRKYLQGEQPIEVTLPSAPLNAQVLVSGTMGELRTGLLLARCRPHDDAMTIASDWGGDAFSLWRTPDKHLVLAWSTAWDNEETAVFFEQALLREGSCREAVEHYGDASIEGGFQVKRRGYKVAAVRGLDSVTAGPLLDSLLTLPQPTPPRIPPFGAIEIPRLRPESKASRGEVRAGVYTNEMLGLRMNLEPGWEFTINKQRLGLLLKAPGGKAMFVLGADEEVPSFSSRQRIIGDVAELLRQALPGVRLDEMPELVHPTKLGEATETRWRIFGSQATARLLQIPICEKTGTLWLMTMTLDPFSMVTDRLVDDLSWTTEESPYCGELNP